MQKKYKPEIKINEKSWLTNNAIDTFAEIYNSSDKTINGFIDKTLNSISGISGNKINKLSKVDNIEFQQIKEDLINIIQKSTTMDVRTKKSAIKNLEDKIINALKADKSITIKSGSKQFNDNLSHVLRDIIDSSENVFFKKGFDPDAVVKKIKKLNNSRIAFAIPITMGLAITNQFLNRYLTKKRTGIDNFVGENGYENNVQNKNKTKKEKGLLTKKLLSAGVFTAMLLGVMGVKRPSDIIKRLEFNGPATSGDAIKVIFGTLVLGRIFASKSSTELRETNVRDYLGFLNWLVLGGFVAKGVGQILDPHKKDLFNISKEGKGIKHWLQSISLKSQKEIITQGGNIKKNLRNLNIAQLSGLAYSAIMLGYLLPKLNIAMTKGKKNPEQFNQQTRNEQVKLFLHKNYPKVFKDFLKA